MKNDFKREVWDLHIQKETKDTDDLLGEILIIGSKYGYTVGETFHKCLNLIGEMNMLTLFTHELVPEQTYTGKELLAILAKVVLGVKLRNSTYCDELMLSIDEVLSNEHLAFYCLIPYTDNLDECHYEFMGFKETELTEIAMQLAHVETKMEQLLSKLKLGTEELAKGMEKLKASSESMQTLTESYNKD